ncbi:YbaB/EbfC family nucleoid-associated protein [Streptomyces sp. NPDC086010]|uniref:YbaB/EbfC family nucleoid-associated protein n=1 Tax=Streptomyces sp. NPDC086010 TaxID=3365745 RepID=UPI0037CD43B0
MDLDDDGFSLGQLLDSTRKLQEDLARAQEELRLLRVDGTAGGGAVRATLDGKGALANLVISPAVADPGNARGLADLVVSAVRDAQQTLADRHEERLVPALESLRTGLRDISG